MKNYFDKYLKYKLKYLKLKNQNGAGVNDFIKNLFKKDAKQDLFKKDAKQDLFKEHNTILENYGISEDVITSMDIEKLRDTIKSVYLIEKHKNLFDQYNVYNVFINDINIPSSKILLDNLKSIKIIEKNKQLFEDYNIYKNGDEIPYWNILLDNLNSIKLIEENKDYFTKYGIYKNGDIIPFENDLTDKMLLIMTFPSRIKLLIKYGIYKDDDGNLIKNDDILNFLKKYERELFIINLIEDDTVLVGDKVKIYDQYKDDMKLLIKYGIDENDLYRKGIINPLKKYERELSIIKLLENDTVLVGDKVKIYDQYKNNLNKLKNFYNYKTIQIPKSFYISGLIKFAVYKNEKLNKIIYLLGEQHSLTNLCDNNEINTKNVIPYYKASDFFFSLLKSGIKGENNLDVFLEMNYNSLDKNNKFFRKIPEYQVNSYMLQTFTQIYDNNCKPIYTKTLYKEDDVCLYDRNIRFHHADLRYIDDKFVIYIRLLFFTQYRSMLGVVGEDSDYDKNIKQILSEHLDYDKKKLLILFNSSIFLEKIKKQIRNIKIDYIREFFDQRLLDFTELCIYNINEDLLSVHYIKSMTTPQLYDTNIWLTVQTIFTDIMDMYLMSRVFRSFYDENGNEIYDSKNIIIYAGNQHIKNYIKMFEDLNFEEKYHYTNSAKNKEACLKVDNFNIEYFS